MKMHVLVFNRVWLFEMLYLKNVMRGHQWVHLYPDKSKVNFLCIFSLRGAQNELNITEFFD